MNDSTGDMARVPPEADEDAADPRAEAAPEAGDEHDDDADDDVDGNRAQPGRRPAQRAPEVSAFEPMDRFEDVVTGRFDAEEESAEAAPLKRVLAPLPETPKLHKVLAQAGLGSRLEMEQLIMEGRISVNNEPAHIGQRIQFGDQIKVNGKPIRVRIAPPPARVIA